MIREQDLSIARTFAENGELDQAYLIVKNWLMENPNDVLALVILTFVLRKARKLPEAFHIAKKVTDLDPTSPAGWINYGQICNELFRADDAERAYKRGLSVAKDPNSIAMLYTNLSALHIDLGQFDSAYTESEKALEHKPDSGAARSNLGFCQLAKRQWVEGWKNYRKCLGTDSRRKSEYRNPPEPEWDGSKDKRVILYGEQGIGDEICFASMLPDAIRDCAHVILDVDARLETLFKRSFPKASVYGTRQAQPGDGRVWDKSDRAFDASLAIAQIGEFYRKSDSDFPASTYLVADPDRVLMWKALWKQKAKPVIGIAWTGGIWQTGAKWRNLQLEQYLPIMQSIDAHFVCLQYKDAAKEIAAFTKRHPEIDIVQYPHATLTNNYDDTAALVASLDCVVSVPTAVVHLAAALGTPCIAMNSPHRCWKFYGGLIMHPAVELIPNSGWDKTIMEASDRVGEKFKRQEAA
jgi:tetratricopeptide (TPR) repeat protein